MSTFENSFRTNYFQSNDAPCFGVSIPQKQFIRSEQQQPRFSLSLKNKVNIKEFQLQHKIIYVKIQLQLDTIFNIIQPKVLNIKKNVLNKMKNVRSQEQINYVQQKMVYQYTKQTVNKIKNFSRNYQAKILSDGFNRILSKVTLDNNEIPNNLRNKKKSTDKRYSETLRINSKNEDSLRISDLGIDKQYSNSCLMNPKKKNKQLKKHKQHFQKIFQDFNVQFTQLLNHHQQQLKKK